MAIIYTSPHGNVPIPAGQTVWSSLERQAAVNGGKSAFVCGITGRSISFRQAHEQALQICSGLFAHGIKRGDTVVLHSFNCLEYPLIFFALNRLGAICSPSSPLFNANELADQIEVSDAIAVISHKAFAKVAVDATKLRGIDSRFVFTVGEGESPAPLTSIEYLIEKNYPWPNLPPVDPEAVAALPFSSGTTGRPKGVMLTARAMFSTVVNAGYLEPEQDYMLGMLPFFHILAMMIFQLSTYRGFSLVVLPRFDPEHFLRVIEQYKIERLSLAPPLVTFLAKHPLVDKYDLSHVKIMGTGGAPLGVEVEAAAEKRIGAKLGQGYGMTEFCAPVTVSSETHSRPGASGRLIPNTEMKVKSLDTDADLPPNQPGELLFRTQSCLKGYYKNPEATRDVFTPDGFVRTGDIGYIDEDGFVFIIDRLKEMIKYKGHQIAPAELEDILTSHPAVEDSCCVRGIDPATGEEIPKAYVALRDPKQPVAPQELIEFVAAKVAGYKRVREVEVIDAIPKSLSGKVLRRELQVRENAKVSALKSRL